MINDTYQGLEPIKKQTHTCKDCIWFSTEIIMGRNDTHCLINYTLVKPDYPQCERFAFNYGEVE